MDVRAIVRPAYSSQQKEDNIAISVVTKEHSKQFLSQNP